MMIPKSIASTVTAWFISGIGLAALLPMSLASAQAEPPTSGQATTAPVVVATASAQAQTLPRVTVVSLRPTPCPTPRVAAVQHNAMAPEKATGKVCGAHEDTLRVLKLTTIEDGVRVHYQFAVSGASTWTNMNRPLLRQFGIRPGGTFCLPHDSNSYMKSAVAADAD